MAGCGVGRPARRTLEPCCPPPRADQADVISSFAADGRGRVQWKGQSWAAQNLEPSRPLSQGERVEVMGREGNCLQVMAQEQGPDPA